MNRKQIKTTLFASTMIAGVMLAAPVFAQDADADNDEAIVVTGTLIRNPNLVASSPVNAVGEEEMDLRQTNVAEELLRELPGVVPSVGSAVNNGNGGASYVDLRGLGNNRNLVLLDGNRLVPAGLGGQVDLNNIPLALVERVDVLTGGASTTYGADAVAGVVNFLLKDDFAGVELGASEQITEKGDGNVFRGDLTIGANFDDGRGNVTLSVGYQQSDAVYQGDRGFSRVSRSSKTGNPQGSFTSVPTIFGPFPEFDDDNAYLQSTGTGFTNDLQTFNFNPYNIFQTPFERFNIFGTARYEVADNIEVYSRGLFSKQTVSTIIAPSGTFGNEMTFNIGNPFLTAGQRSTICAGFGWTVAECSAAALTTDPTNPAYREFTQEVYRRFVEGGPRLTDFTTTVFDYRIGIRGDITSNLTFDLSGAYGESENHTHATGQGLFSRLLQASDAILDSGGQIVCRDTSNGCVPLNLFGPEGSITPEAFKFLNVSTSGSFNASLSQVRGLVSGDFGASLPWASEPISIAVGAEYRKYQASQRSDAATQTPGEVLGAGGGVVDVVGIYDVYEAFGELVFPIVSDKPFFHSLTLELGGRVSDYSTSGTSYTYKAGLSWEPVSSLKLRGTYNRAARSPNISELYTPLGTALTNLAVDPCQGALPVGNAELTAICIAQGAPAGTIGSIPAPSAGQINFTSGGNVNLDVEKATTWTVGAVFQPDFIPGFSASIDYYNIKIEDAITVPTVGDALRACFGAPPYNAPAAGASTTAACTSIRRSTLSGSLSGSVATVPGLSLALSNQGLITTSGIDVHLNYRRDLGFARLNLSLSGNWTDSLKFRATPVSINRECVGYYSVNCTPGSFVASAGSLLPEFSFNQRTTLSFGSTDVSLLWRYLSGMDLEPGSGTFLPAYSSIPAFHYFDLSVRQEVGDHFTFVVTVQNLFDKQPPIVGNTIGSTSFNSGNTFPATYDTLGRRFAVSANVRF